MSLILDGTNGLSDVDGSAATPAIRGSDANTGVFFGTDIVGVSTGGTERMRVDASGNVGIGTSSPVTVMHTVGANVDSATNLATSTSNAKLRFQNASSSSLSLWQGVVESGSKWYTQVANGNGTTPYDMVINPFGGNLLVGTTSTIDGSRMHIIAQTSNGCITTKPESNRTYDGMTFRNFAGSYVGYISVGTSSTTYATSSDYRLKHDIAPMTGALAKVAALKPCTYKWNSDGSDAEGFIAHELQEVCPSAVTGEKDAVETYTDENGVEQTRPKYQGIDTSFLVATLTAAIQEQQAIIESLTARVVALEGA